VTVKAVGMPGRIGLVPCRAAKGRECPSPDSFITIRTSQFSVKNSLSLKIDR
jgi:hypothetical protein